MTSRGSQSHGGQVRRKAHVCAGCAELADSGPSARYARRALLRAAVFDNPVFDGREQELWATRRPTAASVVTGVLTEVTPHAIVVLRPEGEQFVALSPSTVTWRNVAKHKIRRRPFGSGRQMSLTVASWVAMEPPYRPAELLMLL